VFELQTEAADCGYVGASVLLGLIGVRRSVAALKDEVGTTFRGLSIRQLRDLFRHYGLNAEAIRFNRSRPESYPCPGLLLLARGHYIVIASRHGEMFEVYDPNFGWQRLRRSKLARLTQGLGIEVDAADSGRTVSPTIPPLPAFFWSLFRTRLAFAATVAIALTQIVALSLPLLSQQSIDRLSGGFRPSLLETVGLGLVAISGLSMLTSFVSSQLSLKVSRRAARRLGQHSFDRLARQPISWFARTSPASIQYQINGLDLQYGLVAELLRTGVTVGVTLVVGLLAFLVVSPWLALPGLIGASISIGLDLLFNRWQLALQQASTQTLQRRAAFNYDLLTQIPLLARFGAMSRGRIRYASIVAQSGAVDARLQALRNWRGLVLGLVKSADTLVFVTLSAVLMSQGAYSLGAFVALGVYKDLVAQSLLNAFALRQRLKQTEAYRLQTSELLATDLNAPVPGGLTVTEGRVEFDNVSFRYGTLDRDVLRNVQLTIRPGECVVLRGVSGGGKSTIARLLCGSIAPTSGCIRIDGQEVRQPMFGFGSVLQEDRLVSGSIRENVLLFRDGFGDEDVFRALACAELDDFVGSLPMRLHSHATEHSGGLSGGQRQRLLIARAVLGGPRLIVLDEATASLEVARESAIVRRLRDTGATLFVISHRPEVWSLADRLLEVVDGEIRETVASSPVSPRTPAV
jgi:ATP-binding cassette subfamily B protein RaxB